MAIHILRDGVDIEESPVILNEENNWSKTIYDLPNIDENNNQIHYEIVEEKLENFKSTITMEYDYTYPTQGYREIGYDIRNEFIKNITAHKEWINGPEEKPDIQLQLYERYNKVTTYNTRQIVKKVGEPITLKDGDVSYTWNDLPFYDYTDYYWPQEIHYYVEELEVPNGYEVSYSDEQLTVFNTFTGKGLMEKIYGVKTWDDENDKLDLRPESIILELFLNDILLESIEVKEKDEWVYSFEEYPKYNEGILNNYYIKEIPVPHYNSEVNGYNVVNTINIEPLVPLKPSNPEGFEEDIILFEKSPTVESIKEETPNTGILGKNNILYVITIILFSILLSTLGMLKRQDV